MSAQSEARQERIAGELSAQDVLAWSSRAKAAAELAERPPADIADELTELATAATGADDLKDIAGDARHGDLTGVVTEFLTGECGITEYTGGDLSADLVWGNSQPH